MLLINSVNGQEIEVCVGIFRLFEISEIGSHHIITLLDGKIVEAVLISEKVVDSRYAGTIVVYRDIRLGKYFITPTFEFYDGRYKIK